MIRSNQPAIHTYKIYEIDHRLSQAYWIGYLRHNVIYRKVYNMIGQELKDEYLTENHAIMMYDPFLESPMNGENK